MIRTIYIVHCVTEVRSVGNGKPLHRDEQKRAILLEKTRQCLETSEEDKRLYSYFQVSGFICPISAIAFI